MNLFEKTNAGATQFGAGGGGQSLDLNSSSDGFNFWDKTGYSVGAGAEPSAMMDHESMSEVSLTGEVEAKRGTNVVTAVLATLGLIILGGAGFLAWEAMEAGEDPVEYIIAFVLGEEMYSEPEPIDSPEVEAKEEVVAEVREEEVFEEEVAVNPLENPYWALPNVFEGIGLDGERAWSPQEQTAWQAGITHRYRWQRYKTVIDIVTERLRGSEAILWKALDENKLWIRMRAVMGLADFGVALGLDAVEKAMGSAPSGKVYKFVKRFKKRATDGELMVLRYAIRIADEKTRLLILKILSKAPRSPMRDLYLVAGLYDTGSKVKKEIPKLLPVLSAREMQFYKDVVLGRTTLDEGPREEGMTPEVAEEQMDAEVVSDEEIEESIEFFEEDIEEGATEEGEFLFEEDVDEEYEYE